MSRPTIALVLFLLALLPSVAFSAGEGFYLGGQFGANLMTAAENQGVTGSFNTTYVPVVAGFGSVVAGYDFDVNYPSLGEGRVEIEGSMRQNEVDKVKFQDGNYSGGGKIKVMSLLVNSFYDYHGQRPLLPYIGFGAGVAVVSSEKTTVAGAPLANGTDTVFAWQLGTGIGLEVTSSLTLDCGYRFFVAQDPKFKDSRGRNFTSEYKSSTFLFGARYTF